MMVNSRPPILEDVRYPYLEVDHPLYIIPMTPSNLEGKHAHVFVLMGPTGSGKSSFIEALAPLQALSLSKDTLSSVTQEIHCYWVVNVNTVWDHALILVDTPGFMDPRMSEGRITNMIRNTLTDIREWADEVLVTILYFLPITDVRMGGSKREAVDLFQQLANAFMADDISVVTTMWNRISNRKQIDDANRRRDELASQIFSWSDRRITKFDLTTRSALCSLGPTEEYGWRAPRTTGVDPRNYQFLLYRNMVQRINQTLDQLKELEDDRKCATRPGHENPALLEAVDRQQQMALVALYSFLDDLYEMNVGLFRAFLRALSKPLPNPCPFRYTLVGSYAVPRAVDEWVKKRFTRLKSST